MENFIQIEKIVEGTYGIVYKGKNKYTGQYVAMKKIEQNEVEGIPATAIREISILKDLHHPNILQLKDVFMEASCLYLILECFHMDLKRYMDKLGSDMFIDPRTVKSYLYQINSAIQYCHQRHFVHRALKPQNLLINNAGVIKVADFGMGRGFILRKTLYHKVTTYEAITLWYRPPEILLGAHWHNGPTDMWAMGCVFAEILSKKPIFQGDSEIDQLFRILSILRKPTEKIWRGISSLPDYKSIFPNWTTFNLRNHVQNLDDLGLDLMQKMLTYDPMNRIAAKDVQRHPYFHDVQLPH